ADALADHDLVLVLGAPVFRYHEYVPGPYLHDGSRLVQVTDDVDAATRAPFGDAVVADPGAALRELLTALPEGSARSHTYTTPATPAAGSSTTLHPEEVFAALRETQPAETRYVVESTSTNGSWWRQMDLRQGGSYMFPASGGLGFGLPAAVGAALAQPDRPVVGVIGDGSANYTVSALWTAVQHQLPVTFLLLRNGTYGALEWFGELLDTTDAPGTAIPGLDFTRIAEGYGVSATHAGSRDELRTVLHSRPTGPRLVQVDTETTSPA